MSGFIGSIFSNLLIKDENLLDEPMATIASFCDDYSGEWRSDKVDLRFGWLQTCKDTADEQLPFTYDNNTRIVGDIRLDNRLALIQELSLTFKAINNATPDSYLVLFAFKQWGEACLDHLAGDYSFAIWDEEKNYLFCARDHFGIIPFYYVENNNEFIFTNFFLSLKNIPNLIDELSDDVLRDYLTCGTNRSFHKTIHKNIKKLPPAHKLIFKDGKVHISRYWKIPTTVKPIRYKKTKDYVEHFYRLFEKSVKDRTRTNKVACSLSGGMDSSAIVATTKKIFDDSYGKDYTIIPINISYNYLVNEKENYFARLTATQLNLSLKEYVAEHFVKNISQPMTSWLPEPAAIPDATAESQILVDIEAYSRVMLTGFGGDPLLEYDPVSKTRLKAQGYTTQTYLDEWKLYRTFGHFTGSNFRRKIKKLLKPTTNSAVQMPIWYNPSFFQGDFTPYRPNEDGTSIRSYFAMCGNPFWGWLFETTHPGFTGKKVKIRQPFFSLELFLFILALPPHLLYQKSLLRMAMTPYLPQAVVTRTKTPLFGDPHNQNLKQQEVMKILEKEILNASDFLSDKIYISNLLEEVRDPKRLPSHYHHMLTMLQILTWRNYQ